MALPAPDSAGLTAACHNPADRGSVGLAEALRALAEAGLPEDALRRAVEALLGAALRTVATAPSPAKAGGGA